MSDGLVLCHKFLVLILIIFHAEAQYRGPWKTYDGRDCYWSESSEGTESYELIHHFNYTHARLYASVATIYYVDKVPGVFCIKLSVHRFKDLKLILVINSREYRIEEVTIDRICASYDTSIIKVSFNATCNTFYVAQFKPKIVIYDTKLEDPTTSSPTVDGKPTSSDVGDVQYVGVVVGAICIALFTLFSCLTIISARRSNIRDSRRRTIPSVSCPEEDDNRPDVIADNAPPSYDAVMACPDLYPSTPQDTPHGTPETTPHLSLHRRALLNQHTGSLPGSASATPQLHRQSFTPTLTSDEWEDIPEYPPPPYPGLANGDVSTPIPEDTTDNVTEVEDTPGVMPGIENPGISQPGSDNNSRASSPNQNSTPVDDQENPWVLNNVGNSHLRSRDNNPPSMGNTEQYPMRSRTLSDDSTHSNQNSQGESTTSSNSQVIDTTSESAQDRSPKPAVESHGLGLRVAVV